MKMKAAIYARYSSENQKEQSIDDQVRVCREYALKHDIHLLQEHIYFDEAASGSLRKRPGLEALKEAAEQKLFDAVIIDDSSRLSRDNQYFNTLLCLFQFWSVDLISVSDGLNTQEEHAKVAYQFRGIFNELYLSDLKKKTHRGQMGQILRGFTVGSLGYGYRTVPVGEAQYDKKGRLRAEGFKPEIVPEEARIIKRIFESFVNGMALNAIIKELNAENIPSFKCTKGNWRLSTLSRILKNEKYTGKYTWNRCTSLKDPLSGKRKKVIRAKEEWVVQDKPEMRILSDELWQAAQRRWTQIEEAYPKGQTGFSKRQKSRVKTHPPHLFSGTLQCGACHGSMALVSGKRSGYYGCLNAQRKRCDNKILVSRAELEKHLIKKLFEDLLVPERFNDIYKQVTKAIREHCGDIPEEIRLKNIELNRAETRVHNFIEFVAQGRATKSLVEALEQAEKAVQELTVDLQSLQKAKSSLFEPPPEEWVAHKLGDVKSILEKRTEKSALLLRNYLGTIVLSPQVPDIGKPYYRAISKVNTVPLLDNADTGSNSLRWWTQAGSNR
ncbi:MAG: hypothetical protein DCC75_00685 [Proteobacteria bacterium]|nr:MAG: hypothetical protein DCC75_00685 [Pseudomonadota bacterium]